MAYYDFLNIVFAPLLKLPDALAVLIISLIVSVAITLVTKYMTNQELMKRLREDSKELQRQFKESKNNPQKLMELQKKQSGLMMEQLRHSFKPTIITLIPLLLVFGWMSSVFAYENINPNEEFKVYALFDKHANGEAEIIVPDEITLVSDKKANIGPGDFNKKNYDKTTSWTLKGKEGEYIIEVVYNGEKQQHSILITNEDRYLEPVKQAKGNIKLIQIDYKKKILIPIGIHDWFGWLGVYIWSSLIFTMALRKILKVH